MNAPECCPACGSPLPGERLSGLCPVCAWQGLSEVEGTATASGFHLGGMRVPGYELLGEIARGGMGIVYRARQLAPEREVAIKMLLPHELSSAEMRERFRLEIRANAGLEHPAILPVYQVGEHEGLPYFVMKLASGGSLAQRRQNYESQWRKATELMVQLCEAVQFAHERGLLHRDLKPGNILFDGEGSPYISDFGLAKFVDGYEDGGAALTRSTSVLGTPQYMAPEVVAHGPRAATTSSDIYSLGVVLYELLAGRPPFEATGVTALLRKISEEEPARPSQRKGTISTPQVAETPEPGLGVGNPSASTLVPTFVAPATKVGTFESTPRDLEIICLKCLAKEPAGRYASARDLAEDLRRWLHGEPISARPVSKPERFWKWARRNPVLASLTAALVLSLTLGGLALLQSYHQTRGALKATRQAETQAQGNLRDALLAQAQALGAAHATGQRWQALEALGRAARIRPSLELRNEVAAALARPDLREVARFPAQVGAAGTSVVFSSDLASYLVAERTGGFAWRSTRDQKILAGFPGTLGLPARWFVLSPDDRYVAALLANYSLEVWAMDGQKPLLSWPGNLQQPAVAEFHPDCQSLAGFVTGQGLFTQKLDGSARRVLQGPANARVIFLRFEPAGERLAAVRDPGAVELWSCGANPSLLWTQPMLRAVPWLSWSPDGTKLMAAANDGRGLRILSAKDGQTELAYSRHLLYPRQFEFAPDGRLAASIGEDWLLHLWDALTGQDLVTGVGRHRVMRFSRDGSRLTTAPSDHELAVLERAPERIFREFTSSPSEYVAGRLKRSPENRLLVVSNPYIRVYDALAGTELGMISGPPLLAEKIAFFAPEGSAILYSYRGKGIYRRSFECNSNTVTGKLNLTWGEEQLLQPHTEGIILETVQSGRTWVKHSKESIELWQNQNPGNPRKLSTKAAWPALATSPNGDWLVSALENSIEIRSVGSGAVVTNLPILNPDRVWFSPDSQWLVASFEHGYATWKTATWTPGVTWPANLTSGDPGLVTFSDDSKLLALRFEREVFRLVTLPDGRELVTLKPPLVLPVRDACLSSDGTRLWLLAANCRVFEWNLAELRTELARIGLDWQEAAMAEVR